MKQRGSVVPTPPDLGPTRYFVVWFDGNGAWCSCGPSFRTYEEATAELRKGRAWRRTLDRRAERKRARRSP